MADSAYHAEVEHLVFKHRVFRHTCICINNPNWHRSGIIVILCKYIVISDTLIGSWISFTAIQEEIIELKKEVHRSICVMDITFLAARSPYGIFLSLFLQSCFRKNVDFFFSLKYLVRYKILLYTKQNSLQSFYIYIYIYIHIYIYIYI